MHWSNPTLLELQAVCVLLDQLRLGSCALRLLEGLPQPLQNSQQDPDEADVQTASGNGPFSDGGLALRLGQVAYMQGNAQGIASQGHPQAVMFVEIPHAACYMLQFLWLRDCYAYACVTMVHQTCRLSGAA